MKSRSVSINTAKEFYQTDLKVSQAIHIFMSQKTMLHPHPAYYRNDRKMWKKIPGIHGYYHFRRLDSEQIEAAITSESEFKIVKVFEDQEVTTRKINSDRTRYDVYLSSDSEVEDVCMPPESKDQQTQVQPSMVDESDIGPDTYVVEKLSFTTAKIVNLHKFVAICQSMVDDFCSLKVLFLKPIASRRDHFKISDKEEKLIAFDEITEILPKPQIFPLGVQINGYKNVPSSAIL